MEHLKQYISLCWFKGDLDEMPESIPLLKKALIFYVLGGVFVITNMTGFIEAIIEVFLEVFLIFAFVAIVLFFIKDMKQYWKVLTSFFICQDFISIFALPLLIWVTVTDDSWAYYSLAAVMLWGVAIITYINNQIVSLGSFPSFLLSLTFFLGVYGGGFILMLLVA
jgi:hypothetical protein